MPSTAKGSITIYTATTYIMLPNKLKRCVKDLNREEKRLIEKAYNFAFQKHADELRKSGQPYIIHPLAVASHIAKDGYDCTTIVAALLHDTIENCDVTYDEIQKKFGKEVADIVNGVTKISSIKIKDKKKFFSDETFFLSQVDNYRKILLAATLDLRVIIIKLYDRLHNMETIKYLEKFKKQYYARETIEIYAPIAERLGMGELKGRLEDLSFPHAYPEEYKNFVQIAKDAYKNPEAVILRVIPEVKQVLEKSKLNYDFVSGRSKHLYSLFNKLKVKADISHVFDIVALRIIVNTIEDCYKSLGIIHSLYKPLPGRIFDYIARPKSSGYQSIHTTVSDDYGNVFEIQIRTKEMHQIAEYGSCAHWNYKENNNKKATFEWIEELKKIENIHNGKDLIKTLKEELFSKKVFVFTPTGHIIDLPAGSTPVDFAYRIHTDIGNHCKGAKINSRLMPIKTILETGDEIEIITAKNTSPSKDWLKFVKTSAAKTKISHFIREINYETYLSKGKEILQLEIEKNDLSNLDRQKAETNIRDSVIPYNDLDSALVAVGEKHLSKAKLLRIIYPNFHEKVVKKNKTDKISFQEIKELKNIRHSFAGCCKPKTTDEIVGYLTKNHIIKVHKKICKRIQAVDPNRLISL